MLVLVMFVVALALAGCSSTEGAKREIDGSTTSGQATAAAPQGSSIATGSSRAIDLVAVDPAATKEELEATVKTISQRLASLGINGSAEVVDNMIRVHVGPDDQATVLEFVTRSPTLFFRPVLEVLPPDSSSTQAVPRDDANTGAPVVLPGRDVRYSIGPGLSGDRVVKSATVELEPQTQSWTIRPRFTEPAGIDAFNRVASQCYDRVPTCPTGQLAIVVDGRVVSAPTIQSNSFSADQISISGSFTEQAARDVADLLNMGLPVSLKVKGT